MRKVHEILINVFIELLAWVVRSLTVETSTKSL